MHSPRISVRQGHSALTDPRQAVLDLQRQIHAPDASLVLFFCSTDYDLDELGRALAEAFSVPLVGCTAAAQLAAGGYVDGGITGVSLSSSELRATPYLISSLSGSRTAAEVGYQAVAQLIRNPSRKPFGVLLIDGLSNAEERIASALFEALGDVPLVGGSAARAATDAATSIYCEGSFRTGAAVFVLFETTLPYVTFKVQHVVPGSRKLVITEADAELRVVQEINGKPAAAEYAKQIGVAEGALNPMVCAKHPLLLSIGGESFVRGIRGVNPDGSLSFFCAVETGLVLTIGEPASALEALRAGFAAARKSVPAPALVLGFECFSRRREFEARGEARAIGEFLAAQNVVGFCTFGEQFDALHMNQTFTAVAIGA